MLRELRYLLLALLLVVFMLLRLFSGYIFNQRVTSSLLKVRNNSNFSDQFINSKINGNDLKVTIVMYIPYDKDENWIEKNVNKLNRMPGCKKQCEWTINRNKTSTADALLFHGFLYGYTMEDLPLEGRRHDQIWAIFMREAPPYSHWKMGKLNKIFNWTISYRKDSDIWAPYGRKLPKNIESRNAPIQFGNLTLDQWVAGKKELVVQVVSKCKSHSKRENLVGKLKQAGLPVHIFGGCGKQLCARRNENCGEFWKEIGKKYKFYLAFENSFCRDYITEKFWRSLQLGIVPVVYGGGDYLNEAPPNSYIDVRSFSSAKKLTEYLLKIDKEPERYKEFFKWRKYYTTDGDGGQWCKFCVALHDRKIMFAKSTNVYNNLDAWYLGNDQMSNNNTACQENPLFFKDT